MTLFFNHIGRLGQLGNQMFQYASLKGIAKHRGFDYMIPQHNVEVDVLGNHLRTELFDPFDLNVKVGLQDVKYIQEPHYHFSEELFNNCPDNVSLYGFFQTEKYFKHIRDEIIEDFSFKKNITDDCDDILELFENPIALHIRRGDFLINYQNHHNQTLDYYSKALEYFPKDQQVIIFSDDPDWCEEQELFSDDRFLVSKGNSPYHDLYLMSRCKDFIIANSSFSWWGAWLSNYDKVIAPSKWFGVNNADKKTDDVYCSDWIKVGD